MQEEFDTRKELRHGHLKVKEYKGAEEHCAMLARHPRDPRRLRMLNLDKEVKQSDIILLFPQVDIVSMRYPDAVLTFPDEHKARKCFKEAEEIRIKRLTVMVRTEELALAN